MSNFDERPTDDESARDRAELADIVAFPNRSRPDVATKSLREVIGEVLRDERRVQERTLADVAAEAAVSLPYLSEIERGRKEVSSDLLDAVCDALRMPLDEVLERCVDRLRCDDGARPTFQLLAA